MGQAGADGGLARRVLATACGEHLAENDFIDLGGVEAGLFQQALDDDGAEFGRGNLRQAALEAADGGAGGGDDDDVLHVQILDSVQTMTGKELMVAWLTVTGQPPSARRVSLTGRLP